MANNNNNNNTSTILSEHRSVVSTRYILAIINFVAILLGTLATLYFVQKRGIDDVVLLHIYALLVINAVQIILCITEFILRSGMGIYLKHLPKVSYGFGALWILVLVSETVFATLKLGVIRTDLLIVAVIQLVVAVFAYLLWPAMDRGSLNAMIAKSIRGNETKRKRRARRFIVTYGLLCFFIVVAQVGTLVAYRLPPRFYDLFAESRALEYELTEDGQAYEVVAVYNGTSPYVNIPATYNNLPVVGIRSGAITDVNVIEKYKVTEITFGTERVDSEGRKVLECNLRTIADNAIVNNKVTSLVIPSTVTSIGTSAIKSDTVKTITYSASANFDTRSYECPNLKTVTMAGEEGSTVGSIVYLDTLPEGATIQVAKDIYNQYRQAAKEEFLDNFAPLLDSDEYYIDFYTGVEDYYIESIFFKTGETVSISVDDLISSTSSSLILDTNAYLLNKKETGTEGAKPNAAFRGWYRDNNYQSLAEWDFSSGSVEIRQNAVFYAHWIPEYTATLEWDGYRPDSMPAAMYWTDENTEDSTAKTFPVYGDRAGYNEKGIEWYIIDENGVKNRVTGTSGIAKSVNVIGDWQLDAPKVQIKNDDFVGLDVTTNGVDFDYRYSFIYDETKTLALTGIVSHSFNDPSYGGTLGASAYKYTWTKKDSGQVGETSGLSLEKVYESGTYTLTVLATSPYGDSASTSLDVQVRISRKDLDIGGATIESVTGPFTYDSMPKMLNLIGDMASGLKCTYTYKTGDNFVTEVNSAASNMGVVKAGTYRLEVLFEKSDPEEARNYNTYTLTRDFVISPKTIAVDRWSEDVIYNGLDQTCVAYFRDGDICGDDIVELVYDKNVYRNASTGDGYLISATSLKGADSANYQFAGASHLFKIAKYEIKVSKWQLDGKDAVGGAHVVYDGNTHSVIAVVSGGLQGDDVAFTYEQTSDNSGRNVDTYITRISPVLTGEDCGNYFFNDAAPESVFSWAITAKPLAISYDGLREKTYNGGAQFITATISGFVGDDYKSFKKDTFLYEGNKVTDINFAEGANSTIVISFLATNASPDPYVTAVSGIKSSADELDPALKVILNNYTFEGDTESFTISPRKLTVQKTANVYTYNGTAQELIINVSNICDTDISDFKIGNFEANVEISGSGSGTTYSIKYTGTNAGSYPITLKLKDGFGNYVFEKDSITETIEIKKKTLSITQWNILDVSKGGTATKLNSGASVVYNGSTSAAGYRLSPVVNGIVPEEIVNLTLSGNYQTQASKNAYTTTAALGETYTNYTLDPTNTSISWYINPYQVSFEWSINEDNTVSKVTYNAQTYAVAAKPADLFIGDTLNITYLNNATYVTSAINAGNYLSAISAVDNGNYTLGANSKNTSFKWEIAKKEVTVTITHVIGTPVYNGLYHGPSFTLSGIYPTDMGATGFRICVHTDSDSVVSGKSSATYGFDIVADNASYSFTGSAGFAIDAGDYTVRDFYFVSNSAVCDNYFVSDTVSSSFSIAKRAVKLSGEWFYNYNDAIFVPAGDLVYRQGYYSRLTSLAGGSLVTRAGASSPDAVVINYSDSESHSRAGSYTTTVTGLKDGTGALSGISKNYYLSEENTDDMKSSAWKIVPKVINVVWGEGSFVYNANNQYHTAQFTSVSPASGLDNDGKLITGDSVEIKYEGNTKKNRGSYTATATALVGESASDYVINPTTATSNWSITPRKVSFNWSASSFVYDSYKQAPTASYTYSGETVRATAYTITCTSNSAYGANSVNTGTYKIVATAIDDPNGNYYIDTATSGVEHTFTITKRTLGYSWQTEAGSAPLSSYTYDGQYHTVTAVLSNIADNDVDKIYLTGNTMTYRNATSYSKSISYSNVVGDTYSNYTISGSPVNITVAKKALTTNWSIEGNSYSYTYHASKNNKLTITLSGGQNGETVTVTSIKVAITKPGGTSDSLTLGQNYYTMHDASTYKITVNGISDSENYSFSADSKTVTISQQKVNITWAAAGGLTASGNTYTATYDKEQKTLTASVKGADDGVVINGFGYNGNNYLTNAGSITVKVSSLPSAYSNNYTLSGVSTSLTTKTIQINQAVPTIVWKWDNSTTESTYIYNGTKHELKATVTGVGGETVAFTQSTSGDFTTPGTHKVTITLGNNNYAASVNNLTEELIIAKKQVTLQWMFDGNSTNRTITYDGNTHSLVVYAYAGSSVVGTKSFDIRNVADGKTYSVTDSSFGSSFTPYYTIASAATTSNTVTVNKRAVKLSWSGASSLTYDGNSHTYTATVTNLVSGDSASLTYTGKNNGTIGDTGFTNSVKNAGNYTISVSNINNANYTIDGGTGLSYIVNINPAKVASIVWNNSSVTYDGYSHALTATVKGVKGETLTADYSDNYYFTKAGTHSVTITGVTDTNYTVQGVSNLKGSLTINKRQIGITWTKDASTMTYTTGHLQGVSASATNVASGDMVNLIYSSSVDSTNHYASASIASNATRAINAGVYKVTVSGVDNDNYYVSSSATTSYTFEIKPASVEVTWKKVNTTSGCRAIATVSNVQSGDMVNVTSYTTTNASTMNTVSGNEVTQSGTYIITATAVNNSNYVVSSATTAVYHMEYTAPQPEVPDEV